MESLPSELISRIVRYLSPTEARLLRGVSHLFLPWGTEQGFSIVVLLNSGWKNRGLANILGNPALRNNILHAIYVSDKSYGAELDQLGSEARTYPGWGWLAHSERVTDLLGMFPKCSRLRKFTLQFAGYCPNSPAYGDANDHLDAAHSAFSWSLQNNKHRTQILKDVFEVLAAVPSLTSLEVFEFPDFLSSDKIENSDWFKSVIRRLRSVRLFRGKCLDGHNDNPFIKQWLNPSNLTELSIFYAPPWESVPTTRPTVRSGHFPNLEKMELGRWTIETMAQIDWLVSHGSTLRKLYLVDCPIVHKEELKLEDQPFHWSAVYPRLRSGLPKLIDFGTCATGHLWYSGFATDSGRREDVRERFAPNDSSLNDMGALYWTKPGLISQELERFLVLKYHAPYGALSLWNANWRRIKPDQAEYRTFPLSFYGILSDPPNPAYIYPLPVYPQYEAKLYFSADDYSELCKFVDDVKGRRVSEEL